MTSTHDSSIQVGVLSFHNSKETKAILNAVEDLGHDPVWFREENTRAQVIDDTGRLSPDVDVVVNRLLLTNDDHPLEDLEIANVLAGVRPMLNPPDAVMTAMHKYATAVRLADSDIPTPDSYLGLSVDRLKEGEDHIPGPLVQKTGVGTHGDTTWKLDGDSAPAPTVGHRRTFLQRFLDQNEEQHDVRVYVVGDEVVGAMRRSAPDDDWRTNVARGGSTRDVTADLPDEVTEFAREAADVLGLDVAGVDLMAVDGEWHVIEVNPTAGFKGLYGATGRSVAPHIARRAIETAGGTVPDDRVDELASQLDDSIPDCKPARPGEADGKSTVGYTEEVSVNGSHDVETVVAKADTGASRTSIGIDLAADIGAGPIRSSTSVRSGSSKSSTTRPLVDVDVGVDGRWHTVTASVEDRSHMRYPIIVGRDVLSEYHVDIGRRAGEE
jgi:RimK family alpha-L-glutamate ligase